MTAVSFPAARKPRKRDCTQPGAARSYLLDHVPVTGLTSIPKKEVLSVSRDANAFSPRWVDVPQKKRWTSLFIAGLLSLGLTIPAFELPASAHGGGLDSNGGHNCYVPACAGTYHCHQPRGPRCGGGSNASSDSPALGQAQPSSRPVPRLVIPRCVRPLSGGNYSQGEIALVQAALQFFGYPPGPIDGIYGSLTRSALHRFENRFQLPPSGRLVLSFTSVERLFINC
jgi:hypothetical protein